MDKQIQALVGGSAFAVVCRTHPESINYFNSAVKRWSRYASYVVLESELSPTMPLSSAATTHIAQMNLGLKTDGKKHTLQIPRAWTELALRVRRRCFIVSFCLYVVADQITLTPKAFSRSQTAVPSRSGTRKVGRSLWFSFTWCTKLRRSMKSVL